MDLRPGDSARMRTRRRAVGGELNSKKNNGGESALSSPIFEEPHLNDQRVVQKVCIYFLPEAVPIVSGREFFEGQRLVIHENGAAELSFEVSNIEGLHRWVLGWGSSAVVIMPEVLRRKVVSTAQEVFDKHSGPGSE